ncbi:GerAB/ArcD/ProY family transporter [Alkalihalobacillus sp. 1P02AB]|uniref:GerAB/ArcD/ProY family transporter n=1 Tax=Alkalihalobacillus sp. 1P02AB TaxID=3132260 RepID=UPI0039A69C90
MKVKGKDKESVSDRQMSFLFISFLLGSAIVNIPSPLVNRAGNMAWLSLIIAFLISIPLLLSILFLHRQSAEKTFVEHSRKTLGNFGTGLIVIPICIMLFLMITYIMFDVGLFLNNTLMLETPASIVHLFLYMVSALTVYAGIEVMGRMFTILFVFMIGAFILFLLLIMPQLQPDYLLPLFSDGLKPIFHGVYVNYGFPYAEVAIFALLLSFTHSDKKKGLKKAMFRALMLQGLFLMMAILLTIMVLGPTGADIKYSLFYIATLIDIKEVFTGVEAIVAMTWILGSYMKGTIALFALNFTFSQLLKLKDERMLIFPIALCSFFLSISTFDHEREFHVAVSTVYPLLITVIAVLPILFVVAMTFLRQKKNQSKGV